MGRELESESPVCQVQKQHVHEEMMEQHPPCLTGSGQVSETKEDLRPSSLLNPISREGLPKSGEGASMCSANIS